MAEKLKEIHLSQQNRCLEFFPFQQREPERERLLLDPPYQRGDVWGIIRRRNFIRSLLMGVPIPSLIINERLFCDGFKGDSRIAVIDGKQRITTILKFFASELSVPSSWFHEYTKGLKTAERGFVTFQELPKVGQRKFENRAIAVSVARLHSLKEEKEVFDLVNFGGLAQGEVDLVSF